ncbi:hypothetical protein Ddye_007798 [Dipteronia dyeriana]|uniref:Uncharacterized protein n=1 Tax=Dipteronia dyeriana TaxID=168575 RepID=A0AAD9XL50_9ROSI|nr:hypothetical protein Ddye_007798 [Dipteronia dyeriana]
MEYELFIFNGVPSPMKLNLLYKLIFERLLFWGNIFKRILIDEEGSNLFASALSPVVLIGGCQCCQTWSHKYEKSRTTWFESWPVNFLGRPDRSVTGRPTTTVRSLEVVVEFHPIAEVLICDGFVVRLVNVLNCGVLGVRIDVAEAVHRMGVNSKSRKEMGECGCIEPLSKTVNTDDKLFEMDIEGAKKLMDSLGRGKIWGVFAGA